VSFWNALGHDLIILGKGAAALEPLAVAGISLVNPPLAVAINGIYGKIESSIATTEQTITDVKAGNLRHETVVQDWQAALSLASAISGDKYTFDQGKLDDAIKDSVQAKNSMADFIATVKKIPQAA
jgi:hypothetical protein